MAFVEVAAAIVIIVRHGRTHGVKMVVGGGAESSFLHPKPRGDVT